PAELLLAGEPAPPDGSTAALTRLPDFSADLAVEALLSHFGALSLDALGLGGQTVAAAAAGAIVAYLKETQPAATAHISRITGGRSGEHLALDANTRRNLEIFEPLSGVERSRGAATGRSSTLLGVLNQTKTPMGSRLLARWLGQPLLDITAIGKRHDAVQYFCESAIPRAR